MKKNINLVIDGIAPEKVLYDTDNHSLVVLYPAQKEFKKGDKARLNKDLNLKLGKWYNGLLYVKEIDNVKDAILTIDRVSESNGNIKAYNNIDGDWWWYRPEWLEHLVGDEVKFKKGDIVIHDNTSRVAIFDEYVNSNDKEHFKAITSMMDISNGTYIDVTFNRQWNTDTLRMATDNEAKLLFDLLKSIGKKWNRDTLEIEELDISEIVVDLATASKYLDEYMPRNYVCDAYVYDNKTDFEKQINAQIELQMIRKAWNKADGFEVDWSNDNQNKYHPILNKDGDVDCVITAVYKYVSSACYSFKSKARALQFGTQFKELFKTAMGL